MSVQRRFMEKNKAKGANLKPKCSSEDREAMRQLIDGDKYHQGLKQRMSHMAVNDVMTEISAYNSMADELGLDHVQLSAKPIVSKANKAEQSKSKTNKDSAKNLESAKEEPEISPSLVAMTIGLVDNGVVSIDSIKNEAVKSAVKEYYGKDSSEAKADTEAKSVAPKRVSIFNSEANIDQPLTKSEAKSKSRKINYEDTTKSTLDMPKVESDDKEKDSKKKHGFIKKFMAVVAATAVVVGSIFAVKGCSSDNEKNAPAKSEVTTSQTVENDKYYQKEADTIGIPKSDVEMLADYYGIPADKVGTAEAEQYMRDSMTKENNLGEKAFANGDADLAKKDLKFAAHNNPMVLAQISSALEEDGTPVADGLDGMEQGSALMNESLASYRNDRANFEADYASAKAYIDRAEMSAREATSAPAYSVADLEKDGVTLTITSPSENSGGDNKYIYELSDKLTDIELKDECGFQLNLPKSYYKTATPSSTPSHNTTTPPSTPPTTPPNTPPTPPSVPPLTPKDPSANDIQQNDAHNFNDNAKATLTPQVKENGIPKADDKAGNINGLQPTKPEFQNW